MQTAVKIWIWIFWLLGHKRRLRNLCVPRRRGPLIFQGKPLWLSSYGVDSCSLGKPSFSTKPKNTPPTWWPPFVACIAVTFLLQGLMNFIWLASKMPSILWAFRPSGIKFSDSGAKLFAQDDRKEIVCTMRCPQTTLIKKVLRLTTWVGSNTPVPHWDVTHMCT